MGDEVNSFTQLIRFGDYSDNHKKRIIDFIDNLLISDKKEYAVSVKPYKENKTLDQLGYYFSAVVPVCAMWQGLTKSDADIFLKEKCAKPRIIEVMNEVFEVRASIAKMKVDEMSKYIDDCINFLGSHGEYVPPPTYKH